MHQSLIVALIALLAEALFGYPPVLYRLVCHPVSGIGFLIAWLDRQLNSDDASSHRRRLAGILALLLLIGLPLCCALLLQFAAEAILSPLPASALLGIVAAALPAQRSLHEHVSAVATALRQDGVPAARRAVSMIVGRDTTNLDEAAIARAAIESLAENFSDGVVAPLFWCALFGLPGIVVYKAINTADSMIGHRTPRYAAFGWAAARIDDLVNLPASRLSALLLALARPSLACRSLRAVWRDAGRHRSPNAGWPEAAMAGALALRLAGPRLYQGRTVADGWMGDGRSACTEADILAALSLYRRACLGLAALLSAAVAIAWSVR